jgi:SAM-dependent methyltransferase
MHPIQPQPEYGLDYAALTRATQEIWATGDFAVIATSIQPVADALVLRADPHAGQRVLDVACGSGNAALVAARRYCDVTGIDFVPALIERSKQRATAEGLEIRFVTGDAQALPFEDRCFDFAFSVFGVMFAPDQQRAADELVRVCRPGGSIALASWTPEGAVGEFFRIGAQRTPATPGVQSPVRWGTEAGIRELFGERAASFRCERRTVTEYFRSIDHAIAVFRSHFGPIRQLFARAGAGGEQELVKELREFFVRHNQAADGTLKVPLEYLESIVTTAV